MEEIEFALMSYSNPDQNNLRALLEEFEAEYNVRVHIRPLQWESSWSEIRKFVFDGNGPAVCEIGDTWVVSLAMMNALRPFSHSDLASFGGQDAFLPVTWQSAIPSGSTTVWTMPWTVETRAIFYRRDLLQAASIDETTAFSTHARLEQTLERLKDSGVAIPWVMPTQPTINTFHNLTSWIWGAGGDYVDEHGQRLTFAEEPALTGIQAYYGLHRFLSDQARHLDVRQTDTLFAQGQAAVTLSGPWLVFSPDDNIYVPGILEQVGIAPLPGVPCVLGSHLAVMKYVSLRQERAAVDLVRFLTNRKAQRIRSQQVGMLPVRLDVLSKPPFSESSFYQALIPSLYSGRSFPSIKLWGKIEEQITTAFSNLWIKVLAVSDPDLKTLIRAELRPIARRLSRIL